MKKLALVVIIIFFSGALSFAQELGARFGNVSGGKVAVDVIFSTSKYSRIHCDVSFGSSVGVDVLWDFLYRPVGNSPFNWYLGAGPYAIIADPFWIGAVGELGIEYRFKEVPIAIGADWRPSFSILEYTDFNPDTFGLNIRFIFGRK